MVEPRREVRFLLNDREIRLKAVAPSDTLLDFLRLDQRLRGTKEGCAEGDCGACTVLIGRRADDGFVYESVNSCIRLVPSLDGCHVVTIEALERGGVLHAVQQAMIDEHGAQCGFCTPGIVMSLYALWMKGGRPDRRAIEIALQGNLCRCTGYAPIFRAAARAAELGDAAADPLLRERAQVKARLDALCDGARVEVERGGAKAILPADLDDLAHTLDTEEAPVLVAGATDVGLWVTKDQRPISPAIFIDHLSALSTIQEQADALIIGAGVRYAELLPILQRRHPWLAAYWLRIGGEQVRNMGTIGGNIANGSPIGDTPPVFIALGADVTLRSTTGARRIALEDFFITYGQQDRAPNEFVEEIRLPDPVPGAFVAAYKLSKRRDEDISTLAAGFQVHVEDGKVVMARLAFGGMAGTPKRAAQAEAALLGGAWDLDAAERAGAALSADFTPLDDWRGAAAYRMTAARNLIRRFVLESTGALDPSQRVVA